MEVYEGRLIGLDSLLVVRIICSFSKFRLFIYFLFLCTAKAKIPFSVIDSINYFKFHINLTHSTLIQPHRIDPSVSETFIH